MPFFTEIQIPEFPWKLDYSKSMMLMGSCFTENIGQKLLDLKFDVDMNPFGILYNPESIANSLRILLEKRIFTENELFNDHGLWNSYYHHSRFSDIDRNATLRKINDRITSSYKFLKSANFLVLTFGTAWVYELKNTGQIVSNCHKVPVSEFKRFRLGVHEITEVYRDLLEQIWNQNPDLKVIFTVSPIRHWKDGATENQLSKATLLLAIDQLIRGFGDQVCGYFPSYEILMDELRDYRFYAGDMLHLSPVATDYIFERFSKVMISNESKEISKKILKLKKSLDHRPVNPKTLKFKEFIQANLLEINRLNDRFPFLDFSAERAYFEQELALFQKL
ncbi:MAG TPA: GSCFA domain protein [Prolixibacteraceae bacterium]|nr:GSCFA domain protein [Prolixibacteraceae bacterium]